MARRISMRSARCGMGGGAALRGGRTAREGAHFGRTDGNDGLARKHVVRALSAVAASRTGRLQPCEETGRRSHRPPAAQVRRCSRCTDQLLLQIVCEICGVDFGLKTDQFVVTHRRSEMLRFGGAVRISKRNMVKVPLRFHRSWADTSVSARQECALRPPTASEARSGSKEYAQNPQE